MADRAPIHRPPRPTAPRHYAPGRSPNEQTKARQAKRVLPTNSARWGKIRNIILDRDPLCVEHLKRGLFRESTEVDHIDNDTSNNDLSNLQGLCKPCHSRKTMREQNAIKGANDHGNK